VRFPDNLCTCSACFIARPSWISPSRKTSYRAPGWFDKRLPWRTRVTPALDNLVLICPSEEFLAGLPFGKIPDRKDFQTLSPADRLTYWQTCVCESERLATAFFELIQSDNPLRGAVIAR
jgi:hypothetical protein